MGGPLQVGQRRYPAAVLSLTLTVVGCTAGETPDDFRSAGSPTSHPEPERDAGVPVVVGEPIDVSTLEGKIVFDDFEDVFVMRADGTKVRAVADRRGPEFDGSWSPNGRWIAYRDSRRGINDNDEIYITRANGSGTRNLTRNPANDWGPDWSPDGSAVAFNSDRDLGPPDRLSGIPRRNEPPPHPDGGVRGAPGLVSGRQTYRIHGPGSRDQRLRHLRDQH
jgi:hypothetical protein